MKLQKIDHVRLQAYQRLLNLPGGGVLISAVDLCHQKDLLPVTIAKRLAHSDFADTAVVIPAVIHKSDTAINCGAKQADALIGFLMFPDAINAYANC